MTVLLAVAVLSVAACIKCVLLAVAVLSVAACITCATGWHEQQCALPADRINALYVCSLSVEQMSCFQRTDTCAYAAASISMF